MNEVYDQREQLFEMGGFGAPRGGEPPENLFVPIKGTAPDPTRPDAPPPAPHGQPLPDTNPKSQYGVKKPQFSLIPSPFLVILARVMALGARKYGPYNWRQNSVAASVYIDAAERHLRAWHDGESIDPESGVSHLGHAAACMAIILDAEATGNLIDDRPPAGATARLIKEHTIV